MTVKEDFKNQYGVDIYKRDTDVPDEGNPLAVRKHVVDSDDNRMGDRLHIWCPGCDMLHSPGVRGEDGSMPEVHWDWDGVLEPLTISPSLLVRVAVDHVCHSFIRNGFWEFLGDCTHELAGKTVPMVPLPNWLVPR